MRVDERKSGMVDTDGSGRNPRWDDGLLSGQIIAEKSGSAPIISS